jgi:hypothetical protein
MSNAVIHHLDPPMGRCWCFPAGECCAAEMNGREERPTVVRTARSNRKLNQPTIRPEIAAGYRRYPDRQLQLY